MRRQAEDHFRLACLAGAIAAFTLCASALLRAGGPKSGTAAPSAQTSYSKRPFILHSNVNLVVLHATVTDKHGHRIDELGKNDFRVYEDGVLQRLSVFSHADVPVTMGIVIDDSGSMRTKRPSVNAAAWTFVRTSNRNDQVFVVNFNDVYYIDTPGEFAANVQELKAALDHIDSRGGTALYDAVYASLDHLKLGNRDKKVLLVITDGEDNSSNYTFPQLVRYAEKSNAEIYTIGLLGGDEGGGGGLFHIHSGGDRHAARVLKELAAATGGKAFFPKSLTQVDEVCSNIARVIRDQYTLGYYPTNMAKDGSFRRVRVVAFAPDSHRHLVVLTRPGYYAPRTTQLASFSASAHAGMR
ncbi:MAG TPA: VWA domain-containing protein [Terriglobia bacterium]|nr:VWA domain-containing protein [Terriglobia bacterium]